MERKQMMAYALGAAMVGGSLIGTTAVLAGPAPVDVQQVEVVDTPAAESGVDGASDETVLTEAAPVGETMESAEPTPDDENAEYDEAENDEVEEAEHEELEEHEEEDPEAESDLDDEHEDETEEDHEDEHGAY